MAMRTAGTYLRRLAQQISHKQSALRSTRLPISTSVNLQGTWEPSNLKLGPDIPEYSLLHLKLKGYDYAVLENFATYVSRTCERLNLDADCFAVPGMDLKITTLVLNSNKVDNTYNVTKYERVVELNNVPNTRSPVLMDILKSTVAAGVEITLKVPTAEEEEYRYIPNRELDQIQEKLSAQKKKRY